jgi:hypothetical protein
VRSITNWRALIGRRPLPAYSWWHQRVCSYSRFGSHALERPARYSGESYRGLGEPHVLCQPQCIYGRHERWLVWLCIDRLRFAGQIWLGCVRWARYIITLNTPHRLWRLRGKTPGLDSSMAIYITYLEPYSPCKTQTMTVVSQCHRSIISPLRVQLRTEKRESRWHQHLVMTACNG